jgi:pimeloyl-ACP methyl ester carboxylesterase
MTRHVHGFETLEHAADAIADYLPHRRRPENSDGLKKNLRYRDGRWHWHWDPAFVTSVGDDPFVDVDQLEDEAIGLRIPILLIRGKLSDVVSPEGVDDFLAKVPHAQFVELSDAGHTAAGDDNDAFSEAVMAFLEAPQATTPAPS